MITATQAWYLGSGTRPSTYRRDSTGNTDGITLAM